MRILKCENKPPTSKLDISTAYCAVSKTLSCLSVTLQLASLQARPRRLSLRCRTGSNSGMWRVTPRLMVGLVAGTVGCLLPAGHSLGVINTPEKVIRQWLSESYVSRGWVVTPQSEVALWSAVVAAFVAGAAVGAALAPKIVDRVGRKLSLLITEVLAAISGGFFLSCYVAEYVELMLLGRLVAGLSAGLATSAAGLYMSEISPPSASGVFSAIVPVGMTLGMLIAYIGGLPAVLGNACYWPLLLSAHLIYVVIGLLLLPFAPESPAYYYVVLGDEHATRKELVRLRGTSEASVVADELSAMACAAERSADAGTWTLKQILRDRKLRRLLAFVFLLNVGQQLSGINAVFYYSTMVFRSAGLYGEQVVVATFCIFFANVIMAVMALPLLKYFRRRALLNTSMLGTIACFITLVVALSQVQTDGGSSIQSLLPLPTLQFSTFSTPATESSLNSVADSLTRTQNNSSGSMDVRLLGADVSQEVTLDGEKLEFAPENGGWAGRLALGATVFYVVFYGIGMGPIPYSYAADSFPDGPRSVALAVGGSSNWTTNFIVGLLFPSLQYYFQDCSFVLFIAFTLVFLIIFQKLPEPSSCMPAKNCDNPTPGSSVCHEASDGREALVSQLDRV
ncbi:Major facilitator sugar transporter-like [Trinorchestia longiramus]|nr:Major facilitator sugar transporter-like [Trinorchestia longiramus]